jgi:flagellar assembly factor FliW
MKIATSRFGDIEFRDEAILTIPSGIIGFQHSTRYVILDHDREAPFKWLQSLDDPGLAFVIMDPVLFKPDYKPAFEPSDLAELGHPPEGDRIVFVLMTVPAGDPDRITANLRAPVIVNEPTRVGRQIVLREDLPTRYALFPEAEAVKCGP